MGKPKRERVACRQRGVGGGHAAADEPAQARPGGRADPRPGCRPGGDHARVLAQADRARRQEDAASRAIANAENNHNLDVDRLFVAEASVGKHLVMKRMHARARGRSGKIEKHVSQLRIVVREQVDAVETEKEAA